MIRIDEEGKDNQNNKTNVEASYIEKESKS